LLFWLQESVTELVDRATSLLERIRVADEMLSVLVGSSRDEEELLQPIVILRNGVLFALSFLYSPG